MAKKQNDKLPENGESKPKKKGLFGFLRRKSKPQNDQSKATVENDAAVDKAPTQKKPTRKKAASTKRPAATKTVAASADKAAPKKRGRPKKQPVEAVAAVKTAAKAKSKPVNGKVASAVKAPAKKRARPTKKVDEAKIAASKTAEDTIEEPKKKKGLFGFLKRKKKVDSKQEQAKTTVAAKAKAVDISIAPVGGEVLQMELNPTVEEDAPKKKSSFFTKKIVMIIVALCGVSGATGAAAIVFAGPLLGVDPLKGLACKVAHKADFVLMKEKRVTAFIRSDLLPPRQRIEMLMRYTKFLETEHEGANLITVSMLDTQGPMSRVNFRGDNIGAQIVYAPDPLLSMATDAKWEVRYVNVSETFGGRFMGDRFTLSEDEIGEFNNDLLLAADCHIEKTDEEIAAEERSAEEAAAEAEALAESAAGLQEGDDAEAAEHAEAKEPGFMDNMLGMVGLGGDDHPEDEDALDMAHEDNNQHAYPGDKGPNADVMHEEAGFFDGVLSVVGLGGDDADIHKVKLPGVLGTRVKYN